MTYLPLQARCALEWMQASGERTAGRLWSLVDHYCTTDGIVDADTKNAIYEQALTAARKMTGFVA